MSTRLLGMGLMVIGLIIAAVSLLADVMGIGAQPGMIGWKQILGAAIGLVIFIIGVTAWLRGRSIREGQ